MTLTDSQLQRLRAAMCPGCRDEWPTTTNSVVAGKIHHHPNPVINAHKLCTVNETVLSLVAEFVREGRREEAEWWHRQAHRDTGIPCDGETPKEWHDRLEAARGNS
jgi:hypothetical protein